MCSEITTIIFSKNRACQLELLLRSLNIPSKVIYTYDPEFKSGYDKLVPMYPNVEFILENNFKYQVIENLGEYTMFLVDDDIMIEPFDEDCKEFKEFKENKDIICLSLRLSPFYNQAPIMINNTWNWKGLKHDWGYPMSVSAHIFRKEDILPILIKKKWKINIPNELEIILRKNVPNKPLMLCFDKPKIINNLANQIQNQYIFNGIKIVNISLEDLNNDFLNGYIISLEDMIEKSKQATRCFIAVKYELWKKQ